ncbi:TetR/AcrR family transcriptional regulator [Microbispora corallina]|uniref:TetR family transcriptional regulator n=1 Tax=Microbispora corallina TaxID=83302 RepID=A0ABQ4G6S9_9ACTN|nr:TetR/AcrR family transcriptional regulator [Microbispora corallina]GIH42745.1 TetR family transcriptional regulator [Microbispora corallina]
MPGNTGSRRRGAELEEALLDAAWDELVSVGYGGFTIEGVAERAQTSRPVVYRRWPNRAELAAAAIAHHAARDPVVVPDTGSLRDDLVALLRVASSRRGEMAAVVSVQMGQYFAETDSSMAELRERFLAERGRPHWLEKILRRAADRGEIDLARLTPRLADLPMDLLRHELLMTLRPVPDDVIIEIVDDVFMPLVRLRAG